jgi:hypothetical protein
MLSLSCNINLGVCGLDFVLFRVCNFNSISPQKAENFLIGFVTVSYPRKTPVHAVNALFTLFLVLIIYAKYWDY